MLQQSKGKPDKGRIMVRVYFMNIPIGFYHARNINHEGLFLEHGPIVFPVGSEVKIEFFDRTNQPRFCLNATVQACADKGMRISFDFEDQQTGPSGHWVVEWEMPRDAGQPSYRKG